MYLPIEVVMDDDQQQSSRMESDGERNQGSQHLQHQHPLNHNYQHPQDVTTIQLPSNAHDQYPVHFLPPPARPSTIQHHFTTLASSPLRTITTTSGEHIFHHARAAACAEEYDNDDEQESKQLRQHLSPCVECQKPIKDRFYLLVAEQCWHAECLRCCACKKKLESQLTCFSRDGLIYCKEDYYQRFCKRCSRCARVLSPKELVMRAKEFVFHLHCFNCVVCSRALQPGDYFALAPSGQLYCQHHYEPLFYGSGTVTVAPPAASPSIPADTDKGLNYRPISIISSPGGSSRKSSCAEASELTPGPSSAASNTKTPGQKGRPKKRKVTGNEQEQEIRGACVVPSMDASHHQVHPGSNVMAGTPNNSLLLSSAHLPTSQPITVLHSARTSSPTGASNIPSHTNQHQQSRSKRMRTSFKHHQLRTMKAYFALNHNPDAKDLKQLAQKTGLTKRVLQFQNARAKYRRSLQLKQQHQEAQDSRTTSTTPAPATVTSGGGTSSSDIGDPGAFTTDQDENSGDGEALTAVSLHRNGSSEYSNASSDYSPTSGDLCSRPKCSVTEETLPAGLRPARQDQSPDLQNPRAGSFSEDDSASRTLADYFQQCQGGLL